MRISRIVIKNFRSLKFVDVPIADMATVIIGENNTGKSNLMHALRLCLDVQLSSAFRSLQKDEIHCEVDQSQPFQVLVGVEFTDFEGKENEEALLHGTQIGTNRARIFYRFRPKTAIRDAIARQAPPEILTTEDYNWELFGGGNPAVDLAAIEWNHENGDLGASPVGLQYLQSYFVIELPALRDVEADLQQPRRSPLMRLINACTVSEAEKAALIAAVEKANAEIEASPTVQTISAAIDAAFKQITGPAFELDVDLGLSSPSFQSIIRNLIILLSSGLVHQFEPRRNGLGLNNILYIAILIEYFRKRAEQGKSAGELILIEEPEAHLHPQLQSTLVDALRQLPFQSILTTHSTHVTAKVPIDSFVMLTSMPNGIPFASSPATSTTLTKSDRQDLDRYLDATKSNLLFARKVLLVEGAAELLLLPPLVKVIMDLDLEREGISVVAIHGTHFGPYARLFSQALLPKLCAIVGDGDQADGDGDNADDVPLKPELSALEGPHVKVFLGPTTFEREIATSGNLAWLANVAGELGAPKLKLALECQDLIGGDTPVDLQMHVLRTAKRFGKARFAQVAARHVGDAGDIPDYIFDAVEWLTAE